MQFMGAKIAEPEKLIDAKALLLGGDCCRPRLHQGEILAGNLSRRRAFGLFDQNDIGAQGPHHAGAFGGVALRHHRDERPSLHGAHNRRAGASIAAGQFDNSLAGLQFARRLSLLKNLTGDPVLLGKARVQIVELGQDAAIFSPREARKLDQRRVPDGFDHR